MPRTRSKKINECTSNELSSHSETVRKHEVAMVNKPTGSKQKPVRTVTKRKADNVSTKQHNTALKRKIKRKKGNEYASGSESKDSSASISADLRSTPNTSKGNKVKATFLEDNRQMSMTVEAGEEELDYQDDADGEVSFRHSQDMVTTESNMHDSETAYSDSNSSSGEISYAEPVDEDNLDQSGYEDKAEQPSTESCNTANEQASIEEIDLQVQQKIHELQQLVNDKGLSGATALLKNNSG